MGKFNKNKKKDKDSMKSKLMQSTMAIFQNNFRKSYNYKQISSRLAIKDKNQRMLVLDILYQLKENGFLNETSMGMFKLKNNMAFVIGVVDKASKGGYIVSEDVKEDIYVSNKNLGGAMHGDKVKIQVHPKKKSFKPEGQVVEVLERSQEQFVGVLQVSDNYAFVIPDSRKVNTDIYVNKVSLNNAENGQKVVVKITKWPENDRSPEGEIVRVLGYPGDNETEVHAILAQYDLPLDFEDEVEDEAKKLKIEITDFELQNRKDIRDILTFTIDPDDAKDFDDAISIEGLKNGNYSIGVHIADVSHFVRPGSIIDDEAIRRATSVYLVDRVVPMLPEHLSNNICSLKPNEDRLCFSVIFEIDKEGKVLKEWFGKTIINSDRRFTYKEAQDRINDNEGDLAEEINIVNSLARKMRKKRVAAGTIDFARDEVKIKVDEKAVPIDIVKKIPQESNKLIEEFMLLANTSVATYLQNKNKNIGVYRVHDLPDELKLEELSRFIWNFGYKLRFDNPEHIAKNINYLLTKVKGSAESDIISTQAIKTMAKAYYSPDNIGHFGLSFNTYTHFTSPIRRYPDVLVHRILNAHLTGDKQMKRSDIDKLCEHSSDMERKAKSAERDSIRYKQVEFLKDKIGEVYDGLIIDITDWGMYIELTQNYCEGMVRIADMKGDFYYFDQDNFCVKGKRYGEEYKLGDMVKVEITKADLVRKQLDFEVVY